MMPISGPLAVGDRVRVHLDPANWHAPGWFEGTIIRIDPYSAHRSFHWVELDVHAEPVWGGRTNVVAVLNPKHMVRI
jgi:hypothetical protein